MGQPIEITRTDLTSGELRARALKIGDAAVTALRNVSTTLIHPGSKFRLGLGLPRLSWAMSGVFFGT